MDLAAAFDTRTEPVVEQLAADRALAIMVGAPGGTGQSLPWQKPQPPEKMTPGRVHRGMSGVLAAIGTPAQAPKPRGKSPGWPVGRVRTKRVRHAVIKKQSPQATQAKKDTSTHPSRTA